MPDLAATEQAFFGSCWNLGCAMQEFCHSVGKPPLEPFKGTLVARSGSSMHGRLLCCCTIDCCAARVVVGVR